VRRKIAIAAALAATLIGAAACSKSDPKDTASGEGKTINEGFDAFIPLIDSGIYIGVWINPRFLSTIIYTCGEFDGEKAVNLVQEMFQLSDFQCAIF